ncbi:ISH11-type transposase ISHwa14 [Natrinema gari JCM 14663]|uniref:ISH11-type transposase ISHwa14 n=1 Tax=Natrinema gari JCM 14663 TaxID=1230459 RepID=L9ZE78_9EURY|nr:ISH11-type transposase ISHwa14 [Natrinema gari JCM 14663]
MEFTQAKQASQQTAMSVTRDALAVETPTWLLGDSAYDILDWHDWLETGDSVLGWPIQPQVCGT